MKHCFTLCVALLLSLQAFAQAPWAFSYQAVIRNSSGALVVNQPVAVRISILENSPTGNAVYVERHMATTNANGLLTLTVGTGTILGGTGLNNVTWTQNNFYLKTETDLSGSGVRYNIAGTTQLLSVPYAIYSRYSSWVGWQVGDIYGGGIIFSIWRDINGAQHGLIASLSDLGTRPWAPSDITSNSVAASHYDGASNTTAIVTALGQAAGNSAAGLCDAYEVQNGSYTDWYLPAAAELNMLYQQAALINYVLENDNNPATTGLNGLAYWSSTHSYQHELTSIPPTIRHVAYLQIFASGSATSQSPEAIPGKVVYDAQSSSLPVRAIRRF